ncbi:MAG: 25S rRNA (adenine645-N1)-methyltransferase [Chaenotheca gracillima]|nr:MAG: 25S rRNA (adenine645-N1)-methyltransferase [Chaenotheca gracillima]
MVGRLSSKVVDGHLDHKTLLTSDLHRRITINIIAPEHVLEQDLLSLEIPSGMNAADLKALIQSETTIPPTSQHLYHNGSLLADDSKTMEDVGIADGEMLAMHVRDTRGDPSGGQRRAARPTTGQPQGYEDRNGPDPERVRLQLLSDESAKKEVKNQYPELYAALEQPERFRELFNQMSRSQSDADRARQMEIERLNNDPFNPESQAKIAELIRQERVMENLQNALEYNPEAFGKINMLYINAEVNGHKVKAFVDSGAQVTIMSPSCAEACGIMRLIDRRYAGIATGVGTAQILGRVHTAPIRIGDIFLDCAFTVMEGKAVDLLLGLDMLKRHQACIDLDKGVLRMQGAEVQFLGEADIPRREADEMLDEPTVEGPGGTTIGTESGAVRSAGEASSAAGAAGGSGTGKGKNFQGQGQALGEPQTQAQPQASSSGPGPQRTQPSGSAPQQARARPEHPPQAIEQLQQLGFSREEAIAALDATGGNVDYAAGLLFNER